MLEITKAGNWYTVEIEYDNMFNVFKANGKAEMQELVADLIYDCKIDEQHGLVSELKAFKL